MSAAAATKTEKPRIRKVEGVPFVRHEGLFDGEYYWEAILGDYRIEIQRGHVHRSLLGWIYRLKPGLVAFDEQAVREHQEVLLNDLHPQGATREEIMAHALRLVAWHRAAKEADFKACKTIHGSELRECMSMHHKGVFLKVQALIPRPKGQGWDAVFDNHSPLWITPTHKVQVVEG